MAKRRYSTVLGYCRIDLIFSGDMKNSRTILAKLKFLFLKLKVLQILASVVAGKLVKNIPGLK